MQVDGEQKKVAFGEMVKVADSFQVMPTAGYRVNVIGFKKPGFGNESGFIIRKEDIVKRFSVDKYGQIYRIEVYNGRKFSGMVLVDFLDEGENQIGLEPPRVSLLKDSDLQRAPSTTQSSTKSTAGFYLGR